MSVTNWVGTLLGPLGPASGQHSHTHTNSALNQVVTSTATSTSGIYSGQWPGAQSGMGNTMGPGLQGVFNQMYQPPTPTIIHNRFKCESPKEAFEKAALFVGMIPETQTLIVVQNWLLVIDKLDFTQLNLQINLNTGELV